MFGHSWGEGEKGELHFVIPCYVHCAVSDTSLVLENALTDCGEADIRSTHQGCFLNTRRRASQPSLTCTSIASLEAFSAMYNSRDCLRKSQGNQHWEIKAPHELTPRLSLVTEATLKRGAPV